MAPLRKHASRSAATTLSMQMISPTQAPLPKGFRYTLKAWPWRSVTSPERPTSSCRGANTVFFQFSHIPGADMKSNTLRKVAAPRFQLLLRIKHPSMDPAEITRALRLEPEHAASAGDSVSTAGKRCVHSESY